MYELSPQWAGIHCPGRVGKLLEKQLDQSPGYRNHEGKERALSHIAHQRRGSS